MKREKKIVAKKIVIYTTEFCSWCRKTKEFLKEHKIKYKEFDVGNDAKKAEEMIKRSGQRGVPAIEIDDKIVVGFDEGRLKDLLKIKVIA